MMKSTLIFIFFSMISLILAGQGSDPVDVLFNKYSGREGFTSVYISGKMLEMFNSMEADEKDVDKVPGGLKSIRILAVEDTVLNIGLNFYNELQKLAGFSSFTELMSIKEKNNVTTFLLRENNSKISELLVITGGIEGNSLISIQGDLDLKTIAELSSKIGIEQLNELEKLDQKQKK